MPTSWSESAAVASYKGALTFSEFSETQMSTHDSLCAVFSLSENEDVHREHFANTFHCSTQGKVSQCSQRSLLLIIRKAFGQKSDFMCQVWSLITTDDWKRDQKGMPSVQTTSCFLCVVVLHKCPHCISVCLLIACYTVQQTKHPGYECLLATLHSQPLTFLLGCAQLWAGLVTVTNPFFVKLSLCRCNSVWFSYCLCLFSPFLSSYFCWLLNVKLV